MVRIIKPNILMRETMERYAAVDVGSNSVLLSIAEKEEKWNFKTEGTHPFKAKPKLNQEQGFIENTRR